MLRPMISAMLCLAVLAVAYLPRSATGKLLGERAESKTKLASNASAIAKSEAGCCAEPQCCPTPCITYRYRGPKICCGCEPPIQMVLEVTNPCTGCPVEVPVCLPACCSGEPKICPDTGFLGRNLLWYEWCCGFSLKIAFTRGGDLIVTYFGR